MTRSADSAPSQRVLAKPIECKLTHLFSWHRTSVEGSIRRKLQRSRHSGVGTENVEGPYQLAWWVWLGLVLNHDGKHGSYHGTLYSIC